MASPVNDIILANEANPYPDMCAATYINQDIWFKVITGKIDLKMVQCIYWSMQSEYDATAEELYAISPDYYKGRKLCYGMGMNRVVKDTAYIPSPDHYIPLKHLGAKTIDNLKIIPLKFNIWKRDMLKEDWPDFKEFMDKHMIEPTPAPSNTREPSAKRSPLESIYVRR